jgi:hypothetical protein
VKCAKYINYPSMLLTVSEKTDTLLSMGRMMAKNDVLYLLGLNLLQACCESFYVKYVRNIKLFPLGEIEVDLDYFEKHIARTCRLQLF